MDQSLILQASKFERIVVRNLPVELEKSGDKLEEFLEILESEAEKSNDEFGQKEYFGGQSGGFQDFKYPVDGF